MYQKHLNMPPQKGPVHLTQKEMKNKQPQKGWDRLTKETSKGCSHRKVETISLKENIKNMQPQKCWYHLTQNHQTMQPQNCWNHLTQKENIRTCRHRKVETVSIYKIKNAATQGWDRLTQRKHQKHAATEMLRPSDSNIRNMQPQKCWDRLTQKPSNPYSHRMVETVLIENTKIMQPHNG